ncbi:alpha/beta fold hydrolase [Williamsia sp. SKLECPSW1]
MSPDRPRRIGILAGAAGVATLGAVAVGGLARDLTRRSKREDPNSAVDFEAVYDDRASIVIADDGVPLAVRELGPPDAAISVVFVHGFALRMSSWCFQRVHLHQAWGDNVRLVFFDHRGHGESGAAPAETLTIPQAGADTAAVIRAVAPDGPVVLVGHSMGGMAVMALAAREPELFGDKVIAAGLISTAARGIAEMGVGQGLRNPLLNALRYSVRRAPKTVQTGRGATRALVTPVLTAGAFGSTFHSPSLGAFASSMIHDTPVDTVVHFLQALEDHDETAGLQALRRVPTMVACGYEDRITPLARSVELHGQLGDCDLVGVPGCGHLVPMEKPGVISDAVERLVAHSVHR